MTPLGWRRCAVHLTRRNRSEPRRYPRVPQLYESLHWPHPRFYCRPRRKCYPFSLVESFRVVTTLPAVTRQVTVPNAAARTIAVLPLCFTAIAVSAQATAR